MATFPGPPIMTSLGHAEPLPRTFERLLATRDGDQIGGRTMTPAEIETVVGFWNVRVAHGRLTLWSRLEQSFKILRLTKLQALGLKFDNGTTAIITTPGVRPVDLRRRRSFAPLPMSLPTGTTGFWACRGWLTDAYDAHLVWLDPADALAAYKAMLAAHPDLSANGWRQFAPMRSMRALQVKHDASHAFFRAEPERRPNEAAAEFARAFAFLSVVEQVPDAVPKEGRNSYGFKHTAEAWLRHLAVRGLFEDIPYLGNGAMIAACLHRGWRVERIDGSSPSGILWPPGSEGRMAA